MNSLINQFNNFIKSPTLCNLFQYLENDVWERINFVRSHKNLKIYETTVTQNLLFDINFIKLLYPNLPISIYEARDENTNGNDIELYIFTNNKGVFFPTQAKILYKNGSYQTIAHGNQINDLITYAYNNNGYPLYLLYNYSAHFALSNTICNISFTEKQYDCSIISANYIKNKYAWVKPNNKW